MNRKEIAEIRKNFKDESGFFTINQVLLSFVDAEKNITCKSHNLYSIMSGSEGELIRETLKKVLGGSIGKTLLEYQFPNVEYEEDGAQNVLYKTLKSKLLDDEQIDSYLKRIVSNIEFTSTFAIITGHCTYSLKSKDKNDEDNGNFDNNYDFLITAFCPVNIEDDSLIYDDFTNVIISKDYKNRIVSKTPTDGFIYPVLSDGMSDINRIMYFTNNPKDPNTSIVNNVLGCEFVMTAVEEKTSFNNVLESIVGDELSYDVITKVNDKLREVIDYSKNDTDVTVIDDIKLRDILIDTGISEEKISSVSQVYQKTVGDKPLTATNIVVPRTTIQTPDITVNISKNATDKVHTRVVDGHRCLIIDLDDPNIKVNGLDLKVE